ncbi:MAG: hypothetical protein WC758_08250 [Candidatus Woesearchaeota archaeon]|jgi:hypothetical protein
MSYYELPTGNYSMDIYGIFYYVNGEGVTGGLFWVVMLSVIWIIAFMALKQYSTSRAFTFASFFCSIMGIFLAVLDLINPKYMYLTIFMTLIGFVWLKFEDG